MIVVGVVVYSVTKAYYYKKPESETDGTPEMGAGTNFTSWIMDNFGSETDK